MFGEFGESSTGESELTGDNLRLNRGGGGGGMGPLDAKETLL